MKAWDSKRKLHLTDFTSGWTLFFLVLFTCIYIFLFFHFDFLSGTHKGGHFDPINVISHDVMFLCINAGFLAYGFKLNRQKCLIEDIPSSKVMSIALGLVELTGKTDKIYELVSPLAKMACTYYKYIVEVRVKTSKGGSYWKEINRLESNLPFYINDDTGKVLVNPVDIDLNFQPRLQTHDNNGRRHTEWFVLDKETVFLIGTARKSKDFVSEFKEKLHDELRKLKHDPERLKQFDLNKDGSVDLQEWDKAVDQVKTNLNVKEAGQSGLDPLADIAIARDSADSVFLMSENSEKELVRQMFWRSFGMVLTGFAVFIYSVIHIIPSIG